MEFVRAWAAGYYNPYEAIRRIADKPAPRWGFYAASLRGLMDSVFLYLPLAIKGEQPSVPSAVTFLPTADYYWASVFLMPLYLAALWLFLSSAIHLILRLAKKESSIDSILNITGFASLVVGAFLIPWDWICILLKWRDAVFLGVSHLVFVVWAVVIMTVGYNKLLRVPWGLAVALNVVWVGGSVPISMVFVRPPV